MKFTLLIILVLAFSLTALGQTPKAPDGWRFPTTRDMKSNWRTFRKDIPTPYKAVADFNSDKLIDEVWILIPKNGTGHGLFVFLRQKDKSFRSIRLDRAEDSSPQAMYVSIAQPDVYETACGKGYWECAAGEPARLNLKSKAIHYAVYESATSIYYWDKQAGKFKNVAISD
jgi:hypothetical protein